MLKISFKTSRKADWLLREAETFFIGQGMNKTGADDTSVSFVSTAGYVNVNVTHQGEVMVETSEWENQVKKFAALYR